MRCVLLLAGVAFVATFAAISDGDHGKKESTDVKSVHGEHKENAELAQFHVLFRHARQEQSRGILTLKNTSNNKDRVKLLKNYIQKLSQEGEKAKKEVEDKGYTPKAHEIPQKQSLKEAVTNIVKNIAFFAEAVANFPKRMKKEFVENEKFKGLVEWGLDFSDKMDLYDDDTKKIVEIAKIELEVLPRPEGFVNPYFKTKEQKQQELYEENKRREAEKKDPKKPRKDKNEL
ncbi:unnamed protein product [Bursaphelenchus xylophilus]|uniref:(pine wood nematode) hypothetical protein n=1 Tax=Bursaphelenchus xylophilus TaxID=6326 RepID=A0A1I7S4K9_BURXY|nr:unnamed protein product [Bursaphelenchus xylophilus]CAG9117209.1 unnamed protein product [Bursaphelenchus xylophilus]